MTSYEIVHMQSLTRDLSLEKAHLQSLTSDLVGELNNPSTRKAYTRRVEILRDDIQFCEETIAEIEQKIADFQQPAEDFPAHVASMEASISAAWLPVECYIMPMGNFFNFYIEVVSNVITRHYYSNLRGASASVVNRSLVGKNSWGLNLRGLGYRKLPACLWVNTVTGEKTAINPHGDK